MDNYRAGSLTMLDPRPSCKVQVNFYWDWLTYIYVVILLLLAYPANCAHRARQPDELPWPSQYLKLVLCRGMVGGGSGTGLLRWLGVTGAGRFIVHFKGCNFLMRHSFTSQQMSTTRHAR